MTHDAVGYQPPDYLDQVDAALDREAIRALRRDRHPSLFSARVQPYREAVASVSDLQTSWFDASGAVVTIGRQDDLSDDQQQRLQQALRTFCPWKKGPFELFGTRIDAEWRSDWKWARLQPHLQPLRDRTVADIGCHNGYFMFRMAHEQPARVIGFEPVAKHFWNFQLMQQWVRHPALTFELLGVEHLHLYPRFFDTIFCLGILYHHPDPIGLLVKLRQALAPEGELVLDCQGIPGEMAIALTPRKRYAQARGIWFLPTQSCLETWLARAGFRHIQPIYAQPLSVEEQRRTPWAEVDSLQAFLNPKDPTQTIEGYPAPWRYYLIARV